MELVKDFCFYFWATATSTHFSYHNRRGDNYDNYYNNGFNDILNYSLLVSFTFSPNLIPSSLSIKNFFNFSIANLLYSFCCNCNLLWIKWSIVDKKLANLRLYCYCRCSNCFRFRQLWLDSFVLVALSLHKILYAWFVNCKFSINYFCAWCFQEWSRWLSFNACGSNAIIYHFSHTYSGSPVIWLYSQYLW